MRMVYRLLILSCVFFLSARKLVARMEEIVVPPNELCIANHYSASVRVKVRVGEGAG
jgi:hypothetical protein